VIVVDCQLHFLCLSVCLPVFACFISVFFCTVFIVLWVLLIQINWLIDCNGNECNRFLAVCVYSVMGSVPTLYNDFRPTHHFYSGVLLTTVYRGNYKLTDSKKVGLQILIFFVLVWVGLHVLASYSISESFIFLVFHATLKTPLFLFLIHKTLLNKFSDTASPTLLCTHHNTGKWVSSFLTAHQHKKAI